MCHLVLALPVLALPLLWLLPLGIAVPVYAVAVGISIAVYAIAFITARLPAHNGMEAMLGASGSVLRLEGRQVVLQIRGELWSAEFEVGPVATGDKAVVVAYEGFQLKARKLDAPRPDGRPPAAIKGMEIE